MDTVTLRIPAAPQFLAVVRLVAAGLASRLRFTLDDIEDLKIGVDELSSYLTGSRGRSGTIEIRFVVHDDRLVIKGAGRFDGDEKVRTQLSEFSRIILETVADSASLTAHDGGPEFQLVKARHV